jgi:hypothetical protein
MMVPDMWGHLLLVTMDITTTRRMPALLTGTTGLTTLKAEFL